MWARVVEFMLAIWLAISPFIFWSSSEEPFFWINNLICACCIGTFALVSFWHPLRKIHLLTLPIALWLWALGYLEFPGDTSPILSSSVVIGIWLAMLAIIPSDAEKLSHSWQVFMKKHHKHF